MRAPTVSMLNNYYMLSFLLFFLAGFTDYLDGYLARKYNATSQLGEILDPIADKMLIIFLLIAFLGIFVMFMDSFGNNSINGSIGGVISAFGFSIFTVSIFFKTIPKFKNQYKSILFLVFKPCRA